MGSPPPSSLLQSSIGSNFYTGSGLISFHTGERLCTGYAQVIHKRRSRTAIL